MRTLPVLLGVLAIACGHTERPPASSPPTTTLTPIAATSLRPTSALIERPAIRSLVDDLAAASVTSEHVGYDGHPSPDFALYARLRAAATDAEMSALLEHGSPVIRSYAAMRVVERDLTDARLERLLDDGTFVPTHFGCLGSAMPVARITEQALCDFRAQPTAARALAKLAAEGSTERGMLASRCLSGR